MLDLGVPAFLIQATLIGIVAQRLVRVICEYCRESFKMEAAELAALGIDPGLEGAVKLHRGVGCNRCRHTGYRGRSGIYEVMPYSDSLQKMTTARVNFDNLRRRAKEEGMVTLRQNAIRKMLEGVTTPKEVLRVTSVRKLWQG